MAGTFGTDEQTTCPNGFTFINPLYINDNLFYKTTEIDTRYVNTNEANSINSAMIVDGSILGLQEQHK